MTKSRLTAADRRAVVSTALELGRLSAHEGYYDRIEIGDRRRRQVRRWSAKGAAARRRDDALREAVTAHRRDHPEDGPMTIARALHKEHGRGRTLATLARATARALRALQMIGRVSLK
jgi:hypothetical protein